MPGRLVHEGAEIPQISEEVRRQIDEIKRHIEQNPRKAQAAFRELVDRGEVVSFDNRFVRVVSFKDVVFEDSEYKATVLFVYKEPGGMALSKRSQEARFVIRFDGGKLTFLRKAPQTATSVSKPKKDDTFGFREDVGAD